MTTRSVLEELLEQQAEITRLRSLLRQMEWASPLGLCCYFCDQTPETGHAEDCPLAKELE